MTDRKRFAKIVITVQTEEYWHQMADDVDKANLLSLISRKVVGCTRCRDLASYREEHGFQPVPGDGDPDAPIMFLGEAPGETEAVTGLPFVGPAGKLLDEFIAAMGWKRSEVFVTNIIKCKPPRNRDPLPEEASNCRPYLELQIDLVKPRFIVCLGKVAAINLLRDPGDINWDLRSMGSFRGFLHQYKGIPVVCTFHPSYVLRTPGARRQVMSDLELLVG